MQGIVAPKHITLIDNMGPWAFLIYFDGEEAMSKGISAQAMVIGPIVCVLQSS